MDAYINNNSTGLAFENNELTETNNDWETNGVLITVTEKEPSSLENVDNTNLKQSEVEFERSQLQDKCCDGEKGLTLMESVTVVPVSSQTQLRARPDKELVCSKPGSTDSNEWECDGLLVSIKKEEPCSDEDDVGIIQSDVDSGSQSDTQYQDEYYDANNDITLMEGVIVEEKGVKSKKSKMPMSGKRNLKRPAPEDLHEDWQPPQTLASPSSSSSHRKAVVAPPGRRCTPEAVENLEADSGSEVDEDDDNYKHWVAEDHVRRDSHKKRVHKVYERKRNYNKEQSKVENEEENAGVDSQEEKDEWMNEEDSEEEYGGEDFFWSDDFSSFTGQKETYRRDPGPAFTSAEPAEIFLKFWDVSIMSLIAKETNRYAAAVLSQFSNRAKTPLHLKYWTEVGIEDLYRYFAMIICMSFCQRSKIHEYWTTGIMELHEFKKFMNRNTFLMISRFLHFVDNKTVRVTTGHDKKIEKVRPILDHCNRVFRELYTPGQYISLDESLLPWQGCLSWRQSTKTKATRFGIKSYEVCEADSGYLLKCFLYTDKETVIHPEPVLGFSNKTAKLVLQLMEGFLDVGHVLVMDSWYNQMLLTRFLKTRNTDVLGTIAYRRRRHVPQIIKDLNPNKMQHGTMVARHCGDISLLAWKDKKLVTVLSTYHSHEMVTGQTFRKPRAVAEYNRYMGGVDLKDQKISAFLVERNRGPKCYMKVFLRLFNTSILNAYIIYKKQPTHKLCSHRDFRYMVAEGLVHRFPRIEQPTKCFRVNARALQTIRLQSGDHFPEQTEPHTGAGNSKHKRLHCVRCAAVKRRTRVVIQCSLCKVALCIGQCWREYHKSEDLSNTS